MTIDILYRSCVFCFSSPKLLAELTQPLSSQLGVDHINHVPRVPDFLGTNFTKFQPQTEAIGFDFKEYPAFNPGENETYIN